MKLVVFRTSRPLFIQGNQGDTIQYIGHGHAEGSAILGIFHEVGRAEKPSLSPGHIECNKPEEGLVQPVIITVKLVKEKHGPGIAAVVGIQLCLEPAEYADSGIRPGIKGDSSLGIGTCNLVRIAVKRLIGPAETTAGPDDKVAAYNYLLALLELIAVVNICWLFYYNILGGILKDRIKILIIGSSVCRRSLAVPGNLELGGPDRLTEQKRYQKQKE